MVKIKKGFLSLFFVIVFVIAVSSACLAAEKSFSKVHVDSNTWSYITSAVKDTRTTTAAVEITDIYDANGGSSTYKYVYAKATSSGGTLLISKGAWYEIERMLSHWYLEGDYL